jgi:hypothetical protein
MRVLHSRTGTVCGYLATLGCLALMVVHLSSHVALQAGTFVTQYFPYDPPLPRLLSRVEREIEVAQSFQRSEYDPSHKIVVLTAPALPAPLLAARLDRAEEADIGSLKAAHRRTRLASRRATQKATLSAGEIFGRRFGVLMVASR